MLENGRRCLTGEVVKACLDVLGQKRGGWEFLWCVLGERRNERVQVLFHCGDNGVRYAFVLGREA